jgi:ABC-2 type transport system ATP-binding protein
VSRVYRCVIGGRVLTAVAAATLAVLGSCPSAQARDAVVTSFDDVPVKMLWYCGGHGTCQTPAGDPTVIGRAALTWLRRWLKRDTTVDTGPRLEWIDDGGA